MGLAEALTDAAGRLSPCPAAEAREELDTADRAVFDDALSAPTSSAAIAVALGELGVLVAASDIRNHRTGDCPCV